MNIKRAAFVFAAMMLVSRSAAAADLPTALVDPYLQVQVALAADQFTSIAPLAKSIETASLTLGKPGEKLAGHAKQLGAAKDIAAARTAFGNLSQELAAYAAETKSGFGAGVRLAYCPMADKPWLTRDKEIRNPYYGAAMLTCGSFKN